MIKYRVKFKHSVIYPSTLTSGFGATYIDVDEIYELPPDINIFTFIHTRFNVVGSITVERI